LIVRFFRATGSARVIIGIKPINQSIHDLGINLETFKKLRKNTQPFWVWLLIFVTIRRPEGINRQLAILVRNPQTDASSAPLAQFLDARVGKALREGRLGVTPRRRQPLPQARGRQFKQLLGRKTGRDKPELIPGIF